MRAGRGIRLVLFDLDGVLIDSLPVMEAAWEEVRSSLGVRSSFEEYAREIGRPFAEIVKRLGCAEEATRIKRVYDAVAERERDRIELFPGIAEMLGELRAAGLMVGVVTSKGREAAAPIVEQRGLYPECLMTPDDGTGKPSPQLLWQAVDELGVSLSEAIYVGDMEVDRTAAFNARMAFVHAAWGYGTVAAATVAVTHPRQLSMRVREGGCVPEAMEA